MWLAVCIFGTAISFVASFVIEKQEDAVAEWTEEAEEK